MLCYCYYLLGMKLTNYSRLFSSNSNAIDQFLKANYRSNFCCCTGLH